MGIVQERGYSSLVISSADSERAVNVRMLFNRKIGLRNGNAKYLENTTLVLQESLIQTASSSNRSNMTRRILEALQPDPRHMGYLQVPQQFRACESATHIRKQIIQWIAHGVCYQVVHEA